MSIFMGGILIHFLLWLSGAVILCRVRGLAWKDLFRSPDAYAGYFITLMLTCLITFSANQFFNVPVSLVLLIATAGAWVVIGLVLPIGNIKDAASTIESPIDDTSQGLNAGELILLCLIVAVFVKRHAVMLWLPFQDYDAFLYHLPHAQLIASEGRFPDDIGPSIYLQIEAAYPPLLYLLYGLNLMVTDAINNIVFEPGSLRHATWLGPKLCVIALNGLNLLTMYYLGRDRFDLNRWFCLVAVLCMGLAINVLPNSQSLTTTYLLLALYYSWPWLKCGGADKKADWKLVLLGQLSWSGVVRIIHHRCDSGDDPCEI
jgi:hypothetical protein